MPRNKNKNKNSNNKIKEADSGGEVSNKNSNSNKKTNEIKKTLPDSEDSNNSKINEIKDTGPIDGDINKNNNEDKTFKDGEVYDDGGKYVVDQCFICDDKAVIRCEKYDKVGYCSKGHQAWHYYKSEDGELEEEPFPILIKHKEGVGRYVVAARDLSAGDLIFSEDPLATGPNHTAPPSCLECMRQVDGSYLCPECNWPACDEMCAYGPDHSGRECKIFAKLEDKISICGFNEEPDPRYWCVAVLRTLLLKEQNPDKYKAVQRMVDHNEEHSKDVETWSLYKREIVDFLLDTCGLGDRFSAEEVFHVLGAIDVNSVKINCSANTTHNEDGARQQHVKGVSGHALYPLTSLLSHSCLSNSRTFLRADLTSECRATVDIPEGQEITKQYVSPLETTAMRREKLKDGWYFDCECPRCKDPSELGLLTSATLCLRCTDGVILPEDPTSNDEKSSWICRGCGFKTNSGAADKLTEYFLTEMAKLAPEQLEQWESLLDKSSRMLHPNHYVLTLIRINMNAGYIRLAGRMGMKAEDVPVEVFMRRRDLLDEIHRVVELAEPGLTRRRGISLFETATCRLQIGRLLHDSDRFPALDFAQLCKAEGANLADAVQCLKDSPEGSVEENILNRARGALHEAEYVGRVMDQKKEHELRVKREMEEEEKNRIKEIGDDDDEFELDDEDTKAVDDMLASFAPK